MALAIFCRFDLDIPRKLAKIGHHQGRCDEDIAYLRTHRKILKQLNALDPAAVREELAEYGAWMPEDLEDHERNLSRVLWLACGDIMERKS
jgi:hypothetical protein